MSINKKMNHDKVYTVTSGRIMSLFMTTLIIGLTILMVIPFIWMISASFKTEADVMKIPIDWVPDYFYIDNYLKVLSIGEKYSTDYHFLLAYWNSIKVSVIGTIVSIASAAMAGYSFAKMKFRGSNVLFILYLSQMMVPSQLTVIPRFAIFSELGLINTHWALILPKITTASGAFLFRQAFVSVPDELREAAKIDGAGEYNIFFRVMLPLIKPTLAAQATVQFLNNWNSYLDPLIFVSDWRKMTLPLALDQFVGAEATQYNLTMAACCIATIPVLFVFLAGQKFFMKGMTVGAVKG